MSASLQAMLSSMTRVTTEPTPAAKQSSTSCTSCTPANAVSRSCTAQLRRAGLPGLPSLHPAEAAMSEIRLEICARWQAGCKHISRGSPEIRLRLVKGGTHSGAHCGTSVATRSCHLCTCLSRGDTRPCTCHSSGHRLTLLQMPVHLQSQCSRTACGKTEALQKALQKAPPKAPRSRARLESTRLHLHRNRRLACLHLSFHILLSGLHGHAQAAACRDVVVFNHYGCG